jgi:hypothetical protein
VGLAAADDELATFTTGALEQLTVASGGEVQLLEDRTVFHAVAQRGDGLAEALAVLLGQQYRYADPLGHLLQPGGVFGHRGGVQDHRKQALLDVDDQQGGIRCLDAHRCASSWFRVCRHR